MQMTFNFSELWLTVHVYSVLDSQKSLKNTFEATTYIQSWRKFENLSGLARKFNDLSRKNEIQGFFKAIP